MTNPSRLVVIWTTPDDVELFDTHYEDLHIPLVRQLPGLVDLKTSKLRSRTHHRMTELCFHTLEDLKAALATKEGKAVQADAALIESEFGVSQISLIATNTKS